jgi:hypothetical protein
MYIEDKSGGLDGAARIGWVELSRSRRTYHYAGRHLAKTKGGYKYNCIDEETRDCDKLYGGLVQIDDDARHEYWTNVRGMPSRVAEREYVSGASTRTGGTTRQLARRSLR